MLTFSEAYRGYGPDTVRIAKALRIKEADADKLINEHMNALYAKRRKPLVRYAGWEPACRVNF